MRHYIFLFASHFRIEVIYVRIPTSKDKLTALNYCLDEKDSVSLRAFLSGFDSIVDKTLYIVSMTIARLFGDTNPEALNDIKNLLAERYAVDENWEAHSDYKWQEYQNCFLTVKAFWDAQYNLMREE
mgnify:CR=1 FL=1